MFKKHSKAQRRREWQRQLKNNDILSKGLETAGVDFNDLFNESKNYLDNSHELSKSINLTNTPTLKQFNALMDKTLIYDQEEEKKG